MLNIKKNNIKLLKILCCPKCKGDLIFNKDPYLFVCEKCKLDFPFYNDIPVLKFNESSRASANIKFWQSRQKLVNKLKYRSKSLDEIQRNIDK